MNIKNIFFILLISGNLFSHESGLKKFIKNHKAATTGSLLLASFAIYWAYKKYSFKPTGKKPGPSQEKEIKKEDPKKINDNEEQIKKLAEEKSRLEEIKKEQDLFTQQKNILDSINLPLKDFEQTMKNFATLTINDNENNKQKSLLSFITNDIFKEPAIPLYPQDNTHYNKNEILGLINATKEKNTTLDIKNVLDVVSDGLPEDSYDGISDLLKKKAEKNTLFVLDKDETLINERNSTRLQQGANEYTTTTIRDRTIQENDSDKKISCLKGNFIYLLEKDLPAATEYAYQKNSPVIILTRDNKYPNKTASLLEKAKLTLNPLGFSNEKIPLGEPYNNIKENKVFTSESFFDNGLACAHESSHYGKQYALFNLMKESTKKDKFFYKKLIFVDDNSVELARMAFLLTFLKKQGLNISAEYYLFKDNHNEKKADVADKSKKFIYTPQAKLPESAQLYDQYKGFLTDKSNILDDEEGKKYAEDENGTWEEDSTNRFYNENRKS